jgi:hypothetical protein
MKIRCVTITGADHSITPSSLIAISRGYPFVEWGILLSKSQEGSNRFPGRPWMNRFAQLTQDHSLDEPIYTSGHLCGQWLRDYLRGDATCPHFDLGIFDRIQLNFHGQLQAVNYTRFLLNTLQGSIKSGRSVIFQRDGVNDALLNRVMLDDVIVQTLFDLSHGAGLCPEAWPLPIEDVFCGYAGGLGPDNLKEELEKLEAVVGDREIWIDMETKVRSGHDRIFDLAKVIECLEIASPWVTA